MRHGNIVLNETELQLLDGRGGVPLIVPRSAIRSVSLVDAPPKHRIAYAIVAHVVFFSSAIEARKLFPIPIDLGPKQSAEYMTHWLTLLVAVMLIAFCAVKTLRRVRCLVVVTDHGVERIFLEGKTDGQALLTVLARAGITVLE